MQIESEGAQLWVTPDADVDLSAELAPLLLLPAFDELILGYKDRAHSLDPARAGDVWTVNGLARPIVVRQGRVIGIWSLRAGVFEQSIFDEAQPVDEHAVAAEAARVSDFYA